MVSRIRVLPDALANKIAAGEVVERPASVIKELVENSIDAGATKIFITVRNGGIKEIRVVDNGAGMNEEEAKLAFLRHATSKLSSEEELSRITTLGFRGEALPSIASVAKVELYTRPKDALVGTHVLIEGGEFIKVEPGGCPPGTSIAVRELFYNTPARRKFLKTPRSEFAAIVGVVEKYVLAYPAIHIKLIHNGRTVIDAPPGKDIDRIRSVWGADVADKMVYVEEDARVSVRGYVSKPYLNRKDRTKIVVFVNGRYVKNSSLQNYVVQGYRTLLFRDSYPYAVLHITLPPEDVDVNVHPAKYLVKFKDEQEVRKRIDKAIWNALTVQDNIPTQSNVKGERRAPVLGEVKKERQMVFEVKQQKKEKSLFDYISRARLPGYEVLGQFDDTYIIVKSRDALIIIDQHAAHERIRYERFLREMHEKKVQRLIEPVVVNLAMSDYEQILKIKDSLAEFGLIVEDFGEGAVVVRGVPPIVKRGEIEEIVHDIISLGPEAVDRKRDELIKLMSCKGAIKAHDKLSVFEMEELVAQLLKCENPYTCPHGRPTMIRFTPQELEKMFKRKE
ncbi:MAG: DNA mismatch repair endonuclease MutL [Euryarchaeota archaeon]|nr:DNA mismatch repair endonuclease MutL [Euryarchaeota archaeon]